MKIDLEEFANAYAALKKDETTLRDEFAMAALTGLLLGEVLNTEPEQFALMSAKASYTLADAMIKARQTEGGA